MKDFTQFENLLEMAEVLSNAEAAYQKAIEDFRKVANPDSALLTIKPKAVNKDGVRYAIKYDGDNVKSVKVSHECGVAVWYAGMFDPKRFITLKVEIVPELTQDSVPYFEPWRCFSRIKQILTEASETGVATIRTFNPVALSVLSNIVVASNHGARSPYNLGFIIEIDSEFRGKGTEVISHNPIEEALDQVDNSWSEIINSL